MAQQFRVTEVKETKSEKIQYAWSALCHSFLDVRLRLGLVMLLAIFIGLVLPYLIILEVGKIKHRTQIDRPCLLEHEMRINCLPHLPNEDQDKEVCEEAGCCWEEFGYSVPNCFYSYPNNYSYTVHNVSANHPAAGYKLQISPSFNRTPLGTEVDSIVDVSVEYWTSDHLRILLNGGNNLNSYEHFKYKKFEFVNQTDRRYTVSLPQSGTFRISVSRSGQHDPKKAIFNTVYGPLIVSRGLTELTTLLPSFDLYGIGQSPKNSFRHDLKLYNKYTLFSRMKYDNTTSEAFALSAGVHPFYLVMEENGFSHGVLLVSSFPVEIIVSGSPAVTFRTGDTRLDFHIFLGPTPTEVIRQLTDFVGRPAMPPYWALGYHSCRDTEDLEIAYEYINHTRRQRIPHESDCGSVQVQNSAFRRNTDINMTDFIQNLRSTGRKLIRFQSPHVLLSDEYTPSSELLKPYSEFSGSEQHESAFLRNSVGRGIYEGYLPNGQSVCYPDFFNSENVNDWLLKKFRSFNDTFDGLFLTRNTPLNFNVSNALNCSCCPIDREEQLLQEETSVAQGTVCMGAIHNDGQRHIHYHNMYGHANMMEVKRVLQDLSDRRVFLTSLSTFTGSGSHGGHWGGEVESTWNSLKQTITQVLDFNMFGIPLIGMPVCGSHGNFDQNLCSKWIQVAAFQPLMISYRVDGEEPLTKLTSVGRRIIQLRYSLLPYLYSLFHNATKLGDTVVRSLMFEFPEDRETYGIDEQFMWGSGLMVSPNLKSSARKIKVYFPRGCWYDFYSGKNESESGKGSYKNLTSIKNHVNLHIRGGHVITTQPSGLTTTESRNHSYIFTIALNCLPKENLKGRIIQEGTILAYGELFIDDGYTSNNSFLVAITVRGRNVTIECSQNNFNPDVSREEPTFSTTLDDVRIYGVPEKPNDVLVDDVKVNGFVYNVILETFMISNLNLDLRNNHTISW